MLNPRALVDLEGQTFGALYVMSRTASDANGNTRWACRCDCGRLCFTRSSYLRAGQVTTCGRTVCRFWEKVDKNGPVPAHRPELGPCWLWLGATRPDGYGALRVIEERRTERVHVYSWTLVNGRPTLCVLHHCDNRPCVNPAHLFQGTRKNNYDDMVAKARSAPRVAGRFTREQVVP